jgi:hypothetical protein
MSSVVDFCAVRAKKSAPRRARFESGNTATRYIIPRYLGNHSDRPGQ